MKKRLLISTAAIIALLGTFNVEIGAHSAQASERDIFDAVPLVTSIAPELVTGATKDRSAAPKPDIVDRSAKQPNVAVRMTPPEEIDGPALSLSIKRSKRVVTEDGEFTILSMDDPDVATYVQPAFNGTRLLTAISDRESLNNPSFALDIPQGTTMVETPAAYTLVAPDGTEFGAFEHPWVRDSEGHEIATHLELSGTTITQVIDRPHADIAFPLLADTHWEYAYTYDIGTITASKARSKMHTCFNCFFPVHGAPKAFPTSGERLPLTINILGWDIYPMTCKFMFESYIPEAQLFHFSFVAIEDHIDGAGSSIDFEVVKIDGERQLRVYTWILNSFTPAFKTAYRAGAYEMWAKFADNLQTISIET